MADVGAHRVIEPVDSPLKLLAERVDGPEPVATATDFVSVAERVLTANGEVLMSAESPPSHRDGKAVHRRRSHQPANSGYTGNLDQ